MSTSSIVEYHSNSSSSTSLTKVTGSDASVRRTTKVIEINMPTSLSVVPAVTFNNDLKVPSLGLGTWKSKPGEVTQAVKDAIDIGYRHLDCAHVYQNEKEVGAGIKAKIDEGVLKREDLFVTSKLWLTYLRPDLVEGALKTTLKDLGLDYLDLYLIHWPFGLKEGENLFPEDESGKSIESAVDYVDTWKVMEEMVRKGLTKSIGVSNFNKSQLQRLLESCSIAPVTNQVECHPYLNQLKLSEFCASQDITITAYSPLGSPDRPWAQDGEPNLFEDTHLLEIAAKYNKSIAQILIRYQIERGHIVIPKSVTKSRIAENFNIFDFKLTPEDVERITSLDRNSRACPFVSATHMKHYPFKDEY